MRSVGFERVQLSTSATSHLHLLGNPSNLPWGSPHKGHNNERVASLSISSPDYASSWGEPGMTLQHLVFEEEMKIKYVYKMDRTWLEE